MRSRGQKTWSSPSFTAWPQRLLTSREGEGPVSSLWTLHLQGGRGDSQWGLSFTWNWATGWGQATHTLGRTLLMFEAGRQCFTGDRSLWLFQNHTIPGQCGPPWVGAEGRVGKKKSLGVCEWLWSERGNEIRLKWGRMSWDVDLGSFSWVLEEIASTRQAQGAERAQDLHGRREGQGTNGGGGCKVKASGDQAPPQGGRGHG